MSRGRWQSFGCVLSLLTGALMLAGCQSSGFVQEVERESGVRGTAERESGIYRDLIGRLLDQEKYYAALAHIEEYQRESGATPQLQFYEARALYGLELDGQAKAVYLRLRDGEFGGQARHGLGLIAARDGDLAGAIDYFIDAVRMRPTDVAIRNDLGFALMRAARFRDARLQLSTALELEPDNGRARTNLMLLMIVTGNEAQVRELARDSGLGDAELARLRAQAERLRATIRPTSGG
ncbi:tetratricopeptide repeat protein [Algiphilus sp.]|uniref:tetratricopeptide repeat protein n=1 Tax=Algiphilus sp. TaxID=1872431 RepID=UPI0025BC7374|nr:tetratricopeptide repeat protein [Algiphilus sp.]MCK5768775.1 tetratricopeptide repeat protein [Algiphilus sp.]